VSTGRVSVGVVPPEGIDMNRAIRCCDGIRRRDLLRVGVGSVLGASVSLPEMLMAASAESGRPAKDVSLIILFLQGGLSTIDTLDMKPNAPKEFRGDFRPIDTVAPGVQVAEHIPLVAQQADKFSLIRSFTHPNSNHGQADHYMLTGYHPTPAFNSNMKPNNERPAHGAVISHKLGPKGSVPPYVCLPRMHNSTGPAFLGASAAPFVVDADPNSPGFAVPDLVPPINVDASRLDDRKQLLSQVDKYRKGAEAKANTRARTLSVFQNKAFDLMTSPETKAAFDIEREPKKLRDEYGRHALGQSALMARRLVEAGVRCVTVNHNDWDTHYNNFRVLKNDLLPQFNTGVATLFRDLADRSMLENTLVIVMGEFGRTPRVNKQAGRDHWGPSNTILIGGGGVKGGRIVGRTNDKGEKPAGDRTGPEDLAATLYRCVGIDSTEEFRMPDGRPAPIVNDGRVISELL